MNAHKDARGTSMFIRFIKDLAAGHAIALLDELNDSNLGVRIAKRQ
jgi:hypothetical protein